MFGGSGVAFLLDFGGRGGVFSLLGVLGWRVGWWWWWWWRRSPGLTFRLTIRGGVGWVTEGLCCMWEECKMDSVQST